MLMSEFIERTGFTPTYEEYQEIEEAYYNFDGNRYLAVQRFSCNLSPRHYFRVE